MQGDVQYIQREAGLSSSGFTEGLVEEAVIGTFSELGYAYEHPSVISPDGSAPAREAYGDVLLAERLRAAVERLNPMIPVDAREQAIRQLLVTETPLEEA